MRNLLLALVIVAAAGCDKAIEMRFTSPVAGDEIDTSCVNAIEVILSGDDPEVSYCIDVPAGHVESLTRHNLGGLFDRPLPSWEITGVQVRGVATAGGCVGDFAIGPTIFAASSDNINEEGISLEMRGVLSCADRVDAPTPVRIVDFASLIADGTCAPVDGIEVEAGQIFPTELYAPYNYGWQLYLWGAAPQVSDAAGMVTLPYSFSRAQTGTCLAFEWFDGNELWPGCITPSRRGACGTEAELYYLPFQSVAGASLTAEEAVLRTVVVFGVVLDEARQPIPGATVTIIDPPPDAALQYTNPNAGGVGFVAAAGTAGTTAAGTFTVLANEPVLIEVTAAGRETRRVMASGYGATVVVMGPG